MRPINNERKLKEGRGLGEGADYKPWIDANEIFSMGTSSIVIDYKHGRQIHLLSRGEKYYYYLFRWRDDVIDIREQFPLDIELTKQIADKYGIMHPSVKGEAVYMTTDLLITYADGSYEALSIKNDRSAFEEDPRVAEKLKIEKTYWLLKGVTYRIVFTEDVNVEEARNIIDVARCYDDSKIWDDISLLRHLIARKIIKVDMTHRLEYRQIIERLEEEENEIWLQQLVILQGKLLK